MVKVFLDPFVFAFPDGSDLDTVFKYVENIIAWRDLRAASWMQICVSNKTFELLSDTSTFPSWEGLKEVIDVLDISDIQPRDVIILINELLSKLPYIEEYLGISDILFDNVQIVPNYYLSKRILPFKDHYEYLGMLICISSYLENSGGKQNILITRDIGGTHIDVEFAGEIIAYELYENASYVLPKLLNIVLPALDNQNGFQLCLEPVDIWKLASSESEYRSAIEIYIFQRKYASGTLEIPSLLWSFGNDLLRTAKDLGFLHETKKIEMLLRAFSETILSENRSAVHGIRVSQGGNAPQKMRKKDEAWRRDIDYEYHLHYWKTSTGIEFASIVVHNDMSIPE